MGNSISNKSTEDQGKKLANRKFEEISLISLMDASFQKIYNSIIERTSKGSQARIELITLYTDIHECRLIAINRDEAINIMNIVTMSNKAFNEYELENIAHICNIMTQLDNNL
jgi:hypothetical protein